MHASSQGPIRLAAVVAATLGNGIGSRGTLPWRLPRDMAYFRAATSTVCATPDEDALAARAGRVPSGIARKNAVIMGRNTWESIPPRFRPLNSRINIVVSTTMSYADLRLCVPANKRTSRSGYSCCPIVRRSYHSATAAARGAVRW